jgi:hypothetical protein
MSRKCLITDFNQNRALEYAACFDLVSLMGHILPNILSKDVTKVTYMDELGILWLVISCVKNLHPKV